ncbi:ERF family protein [Nonomuraea sp. NPDC050404]|uniref:ERF family protein n=1 Tax=Nonomuraea sp. NPDC050404 TaxID=3155783 RepID=UPI0033F2C437
MSLASKAAAKAAEATGQPAEAQETVPPAADDWGLPEREPEGPSPEVLAYEAETGSDDPPQIPVHVAFMRVMRDIRAVAKLDKPTEGVRFDYRGIDRAMEAYAPVTRRHGVIIMPTEVQANYAPATTSTGKATRECTVIVQYRIWGPMGDWMPASAAGESLDSGDKGTAKAQAVALRTLLFHGGMVPTRDTDPDAHNIERGEAAPRKATDYRDEALEPRTSKGRLRQMHHELKSMNRLGELVTNEIDESETIGDLIVRIGHTRR